MKVLICPDKFKESLSADIAADKIKAGLLKVFPYAECKLIPMADGGEGTVDALTLATKGHFELAKVHDPLMRPIISRYGISGDGSMAFLEMSSASGLAILAPEERNPLHTNSYGSGELILAALEKGCREIIVGIGGSATVDGGVGMAQALGVKFKGLEKGDGGGELRGIQDIDISALDGRILKTSIFAACDVKNVLTGPEGAAFVFGPQKGADQDAVNSLNANLLHLSQMIKAKLGIDVEQLPGGGAAGGMGAGITAFLKGELKNGFDLIAGIVNLEHWINWSDMVITGEGKIDLQTAYGKAPAGISGMANKKGKPVIAFTGSLGNNLNMTDTIGLTAIIPIVDKPMSLTDAMTNAGELLENASERTFRLIALGSGKGKFKLASLS
jgi:glycerate kinase